MTASWVQLTEQMAAEANDLAATLVGLSETDVDEILLGLREQVTSTLCAEIGKRRASIVAKAFTRLIERQRVELLQLGFVDPSRRLQ